MRLLKYIVLTLTAATCIAVALICAFLQDEHSIVPVIIPSKEYPGITNISSNPFHASNIKKPRTKPHHNKHVESRQSTTNISSNTTRTVSSSIPSSVVSNASLALTSQGSSLDHQSTTGISSNTSHSVTLSAWTSEKEEMVRNRYELRKELLKEKCHTTSGYRVGGEGLRALPKLSYYNAKYKVLGCVSAKAGASTWKTHFLRMNGYTKPIENPHTEWAHRLVRARQVLQRQQVAEVLNSPSITRFISVRHPISRMISAYNNKFDYGRVHVPSKGLGGTIPYIKSIMEMEGTEFHEDQPVMVTFRQFINLILYQKTKGLKKINNHWRPQYNLCYACSVPYDYIIKQETFDEDLQYLTDKLNITEVKVSLKSNSFAKSNKTYEDHFRDIPKDLIKKILNLYRLDFLLFGYEVPKFFKDLLPPQR
ncbi:carbohydrate sulfotransferase 11-like [Palaemon carinicauda]|uniref:carbohydrate sulfotransferase 11-like n=1 Tax=Palaemon carinicauda TaxID=392227 RepID=UPI0035B59A8B